MSKNSKNEGRSWAGLLLLTVLCIVPASPTETLGADLFTVDVVIGQGTAYMDSHVRGFSRAEDVMRFAESGPLNAIFPTYDDSLAVVGDINFRGLDMRARFEKDSAVLHFQVESLNIDKSFMGATRDDSVDEFVDFLEKDGASILDRIQKELARVSPVDPIAGNPNSLQSTLLNSAFNDGGFATDRTTLHDPGGPHGTTNLIGLQINGGSFKAGGFRGTSLTAPLKYTLKLDRWPGTKLTFKLPLTYVDIEGADVYSVAPGAGLTVPIMRNWAVTASLAYGLTGSYDAASVGQIIGGSMTSKYNLAEHLPVSNLGLSKRTKIVLGNMIGRYQTLKLSIGDYSFNPDIRNTAFKNGVMFSHPPGLKIFGDHNLEVDASYAHTYLAGTDLYLNHFHELSLSVGSPIDFLEFLTDKLSLGVTYTFGRDYDSVTGNLGYTF